MNIQCFGPLSEDAICKLESALGVTLSRNYREFLKETGGGIVKQDGKNRIPIPSIGQTIAVDVLFGYGVTQNSDILYWNEKYRDEMLDDAVLIGFDVHQGFLFLIACGDDTGVYYWDDSYVFEESDDDQNVYLLVKDTRNLLFNNLRLKWGSMMGLFGRKEMKHSESYTDFKAQLKATGRQRMEGYDSNLFDKITEQERSEVEKDIWNHFMNKNDADLAVLMPVLKNYDGIAALKKKLAEFKIPSYGNADIAFALFEATEDEKYLDIIMDNYRGLAVNTPIVAGLAGLAKKPGVYDLLVDIYLHDKDEANRGQVIVGILWRDGKLNSVNDSMELVEKINLIRAFKLEPTEGTGR